MSRGFVSALFGIAMTIFSWYAPWEWPAWPAFAVMNIGFGSRASFSEASHGVKAVMIVVMILVNVAFWGVVCAGVMRLWRQEKARRSD